MKKWGSAKSSFTTIPSAINRQRVLDICRLKIERKLRIGWDIRAHINTITEEMLDALAGRRMSADSLWSGIGEPGNYQSHRAKALIWRRPSTSSNKPKNGE